MPTVLLFLFFGNLVTAGLLAIYSNDSVSYRTYHHFLTGKLLQSIAWILLAMRGQIPDVISAHVGNSLLLAGIAFEALAIISVEKHKKKWGAYYAIIVVVFIVIFWGFARQPNQYVYISSVFAATIFLTVAILVLQDVKKTALRYTLSVIYTVSSLILLVRGTNAFLHSDYKLMTNEFSQNLTFLSTYFLMIINGSGFLLLLREHTDELLKVANQELEQLAHIDSLTNLANRRKFREHLTYSILESRRRTEPLTLIMADIDFFKKYNDYYGHIFGDKCLVQVAEELQQQCQRGTDLIARFGGEEFAIVLINTDITKACLLAEAIHKRIRDLAIPHADSDVSDCVTLSMGIFSATPTSSEHDYDWFIIEADRRLYDAKHAGRNQSIFS
ncbi:MAG: diguanylate cyclase [Anaerolineales bacterium]|nr:diguanylate cyclase [Anaerolineales bacterium]